MRIKDLIKRNRLKSILCMLCIAALISTSSGDFVGAQVVSIGPPSPLPDWEADAQVKLGWEFDTPTNPATYQLVPGWDRAIGAIPTWDYVPGRINPWDVPGQWYIEITNVGNDDGIKHFGISWVYTRDPSWGPPVGLFTETSVDWFPSSGHTVTGYSEELFDSSGAYTTDPLIAYYGRVTLSIDMDICPGIELVWLGLHDPNAEILEVYILTFCDGCPDDPFKIDPGACGCGVADIDTDGDGTADCIDGCPDDPYKIDPGACGCGVADTDTDGDGTPDCIDPCPNDPDDTCVPVGAPLFSNALVILPIGLMACVFIIRRRHRA